MLKTCMEQQWILYAMGLVALVGAVGEIVSALAVWRMLQSAQIIQKSEHKLMRLVRAKYEHASMLSDQVANVSTFARKYLYEYRVAGIRLHVLCGWGKRTIWMTGSLGVAGLTVIHYLYGFGDAFTKCASCLLVMLSVLVWLHACGDVERKLGVVENYMVDYLENVCAPRFEKAKKREQALETVQVEETNESTAEAVGQEIRVRKILEEYFA